MSWNDDPRAAGSLVWGLFLIVVGGAFLLHRLGMIDLPDLGDMWPVVFFVIGAIHFLKGQFGGGTMFVLIGCWFFAVTFEWAGLTYRNSWGLLLIAFGMGMVIRALSGEDQRRRRRKGVEE